MERGDTPFAGQKRQQKLLVLEMEFAEIEWTKKEPGNGPGSRINNQRDRNQGGGKSQAGSSSGPSLQLKGAWWA
jgi:hypothetical protein